MKTINNINEKISQHRLGFQFLLTTIISFILLTTYWNSYSIMQLWFEEGSNYYYTAMNSDHWWQILGKNDSGYFNTIPRLFSLILAKFDFNQYFPILFKTLNIIAFSTMISMLLYKRFDNYFGQNLIFRILIILCLGLFPHSDFGFPFNSSYACIIPILYIVSEMLEKKLFNRWKTFLYFSILPILLFSKISAALFGLVAFPYCFLRLYMRTNKSGMFLAVWATLCCLIQIFYVDLFFRDIFMDTAKISTMKLLYSVPVISLSMVGVFFWGFGYRFQSDPSFALSKIFPSFEMHSPYFIVGTLITGVLLGIGLIYCCLRLYRNRKYHIIEMTVLLCGLIGIIALQYYLNRYLPDNIKSPLLFYYLSPYFIHRQIWHGFCAVILIVAIFVFNENRRVIWQYMFAFIMVISLSAYFFINKYNIMGSPFSINASNDPYATDWEQMYKYPIFKKMTVINHFSSIHVFESKNIEEPNISARMYETPVEINFDESCNLHIDYARCSRGELMAVLIIDGKPEEIQHIALTATTSGGILKEILPIYYPKKSRYYYFDLGKNDICNIKNVKFTAQGKVKKGWLNFLVLTEGK